MLTDTNNLPIGACEAIALMTRLELDEEYNDPTLVRLRGLLAIDHPLSGDVDLLQYAFGAAGIIEVEGVDSADALPYCPSADPDASWIWHSFWHTMAQTSSNATGLTSRGEQLLIEIDSEAMRRLEGGDSSLWFVIENEAGSDAAVNYWFGVRELLKA